MSWLDKVKSTLRKGKSKEGTGVAGAAAAVPTPAASNAAATASSSATAKGTGASTGTRRMFPGAVATPFASAAALPGGIPAKPSEAKRAAGTAGVPTSGAAAKVPSTAPAVAEAQVAPTGAKQRKGESNLKKLKTELEKNTKDKDSKSTPSEYRKILTTIGELLSFMEGTVPQGKERVEQLTKIENAYETLQNECTEFLSRFRIRFSATSKRRKQYVEYVLDTAEREAPVVASAPVGAAWKSVLAEARVETLDISNEKTEKKGGGTSEVTHVLGKGYFKKEDKVAETAADFYQKEKELLTENNKQLYEQALLKYAQEKGESSVETIVDKMDDSDSAGLTSEKVQEMLRAVSPSCTKEEIEEFAEFISRVKKYNTLTMMLEKAGIQTGQDVTKRNVATSRLATILGEDHLFAESKTVDIKNGKNVDRGNLMAEAVGVDDKKAKTKKVAGRNLNTSSPALQRSIMCIQLINTLAGQVDHHMGNIFFQMQGDAVVGAQAIDNDLSFGTMVTLNKVHGNLPSLVTPKGNKYMGSCIDKELAEKILHLEPEILRYALADLLSDEELNALTERLSIMKNVLKDLKAGNSENLVSEWNDATRDKLLAHGSNMYATMVKELAKP